MCLESPHYEHLSLLWRAWFGSNLFLWGGTWWVCSLEYLFWPFDLGLWSCCLCLLLLGGRSVLWCLTRFTCAAWGSLATCLMCLVVDFEDSIFLASHCSLLAGNLSKSIFESLMVLETNSSSFKKKPENICARYLQFLVHAWQESLGLEHDCITHQLNNCLVWGLSACQIWV